MQRIKNWLRENHKVRRALEIGLWIGFVTLLWTLDLITKFAERDRIGFGLSDFRLIAEQYTSALSALLMVSFIAWWSKTYSWRLLPWWQFSISIVIAMLIFGAGHYIGIVIFRSLAYPLFDHNFQLVNFWQNLWFECQKDFKIFLGFWLIISLYRHFMQPDPVPDVQRITVQTGTGERIIRIAQIRYIQSARNYVSIYLDDGECIVRNTLTLLQDMLGESDIIKVHRSYLVNVNQIARIQRLPSGAFQILLHSGEAIPLSKGQREKLKERYPDLSS